MNSKILSATRWLIAKATDLHIGALQGTLRASEGRVQAQEKLRDAAEYAKREAAVWASEAQADLNKEKNRHNALRIAAQAEAKGLRKGVSL